MNMQAVNLLLLMIESGNALPLLDYFWISNTGSQMVDNNNNSLIFSP